MSYRSLQARCIDDYEIINQCGSGTYGYVFKAIHRQTRNIVALKKVTQFPVEDGGTPVEIKYLSQLCSSRNIIKLKDHFYTKEGELALVFEYMETDLWRLISGPSVCLPIYQVKCIMKQLFEGLHQCHSAGIMHRDIKPSNLLISANGVLKLADFGLTTSYIAPPHLSNNVVSLYYRPPELLMGSRNYGPEIDVWSAGCILVELLTNNYLFAGANEAEQLDMIFRVFGTPSEDIWPGVSQLPGWGLVESGMAHPLRDLRDNFAFLEHNVLDLATRLLTLDPKLRISSYEALQHPWFWTTPLPSHPNNLPLLWKSRMDPPRREWRKAGSNNPTPQRKDRLESAGSASGRRDRLESAGSASGSLKNSWISTGSAAAAAANNSSGKASGGSALARSVSVPIVSSAFGLSAPVSVGSATDDAPKKLSSSYSNSSNNSGNNSSGSKTTKSSVDSNSNSNSNDNNDNNTSNTSSINFAKSGNYSLTCSIRGSGPDKGVRAWNRNRGGSTSVSSRNETRERVAPYKLSGHERKR